MTSDGVVAIVDRSKDMVISGGVCRQFDLAIIGADKLYSVGERIELSS